MKKANKFCNSACMRIANLITGFLLILVSFIKFAYLADGFNFFYLVAIFFKIFFVLLLAMAESLFGQGLSVRVRTYVNLLDNQVGKGFYILWLCTTLSEEVDRNENFFIYIGLLVALINMVIGYKDGLKKLPALPWAHLIEEEDEEKERTKKKESAKEKNQEKLEIDEELRKKKYMDRLQREANGEFSGEDAEEGEQEQEEEDEYDSS